VLLQWTEAMERNIQIYRSNIQTNCVKKMSKINDLL